MDIEKMQMNDQADPNLNPVSSSLEGLDIYTADSPGMTLEGFYWRLPFGEFRRLPENMELSFNSGVDYESWNTSGGCIRFASDSKKIVLHAAVNGCRTCNMNSIAAMGFDLYGNEPGNPSAFLHSSIFRFEQNEYNCNMFSSESCAMHEFTLYFPLYSGVKTLGIGLSKGAILQKITPRKDPRLLVLYGTSITQGCGVSRPGMLYSNILGRFLNMSCLNLAFSGSAKGEPAIAEKIAEIHNPALFILDYDTNAGPELLEKTLLKFIMTLRKRHPEIPVITISAEPKPAEKYALGKPCSHRAERLAFTRIHRQIHDELVACGDKKVFFLDGLALYGKDFPECPVDSLHANDLGSYRIAHALAPYIQQILSQSEDCKESLK